MTRDELSKIIERREEGRAKQDQAYDEFAVDGCTAADRKECR